MADARTTTLIHVKDDVEIEIGVTLFGRFKVDFGENVTVFFTPDAAEDLMHQLQAALKDEIELAVQ